MINATLELDIFVTHLGLLDWDEDLAAQVNFVHQKTNEVNKTNHKILMGDFNLEYNSSQLAPLLSDFDDTLVEILGLPRPITFPSINLYDDSIESIDYVFASGYKTIIDGHVITDFVPGNDPSEFGSDHLPVVATLTFP
jgi:endonuclease/exonuclease/phosphatase family metal-dependent hydrolase